MRHSKINSVRQLLPFLLAWALPLSIVQNASSSNRFPIMTFGDQSNVSNREQFYRWLDDWGAMYFYAVTDSVSKYVLQDTLAFGLIAGHYVEGQQIYFGDNSIQLSQGDAGRLATSFGFLSSGSDLSHGYARGSQATDSITGSSQLDLSLGHSVIEAISGSYNAGYLFNNFKPGSCFRRFPRNTSIGKTDTFQVAMKLLDNSGSGSVTVAKLIVTNLNYLPGCRADSLDKYTAERINDTLLRVGSSTGWRTVHAIPQRLDTLYYGPCNAAITSKGSAESLRYSCYANPTNPAETVCVQPFRFTKDIHVSDFPTNTSYYKFRLPIQAVGEFVPHSFSVYWTGAKTIRLDSMRIYDNKGSYFDSLVATNPSSMRDRITAYYNNHSNEKGRVTTIYQIDEPVGPEFQRYQKVNTIVEGLSAPYPTNQFTVLGAYVPPDTNDQTDVNYINTYFHYGEEEFANYDLYINDCDLKISSDSNLDDTWQQWRMDHSLIPTLNQFRKRSHAQAAPADFWITLPTWAAYACTNCDPQTKICDQCKQTKRMPTPNEIRMWANMAVLHGARGICYWEYMGRGGTLHEVPGRPEAPSHGVEPDIPGFEWNEEQAEMLPRYLPGASGPPACTTLYNVQQPYVFRGMFHVDGDAAVRDTIWYVTKEINRYLDSMAYFFMNATWLSAGRWTAPLSSLPGSIVDSVKTRATYDSAFVQVGFFEKDAANYAFVLNRRVDDGSAGRLDTQTVRLYLKGGPGLYGVRDIYHNSCDSVFDSCGVVMYDMFLNPGEAKLIRTELLHSSNWSGNVVSNITWPQFSSINLTGDLTVPPGITLTVQGALVKAASYLDSQHAGADANKTELIVTGTLRIGGTQSQPAYFGPSSYADTARAAWRGIRVNGSGKIYIDHALIKGAYNGVETYHTTKDTIQYTRFENCMMHGLYAYQAPLYLYRDTFICQSTRQTTFGVRLDGILGGGIIEDEMMNTGGSDGDSLFEDSLDQEENSMGGGSGPVQVTASNCYFKDMEYPLQASSCHLGIELSKFATSVYKGSGHREPAITLSSNTVTTISHSDVTNYGTAVRLETGADATIADCRFGASLVNSYNIPSMYDGVVVRKVGPGYATCSIRRTCFFPVQHRSLIDTGAIIDLGNYLDAGHNNFLNLVFSDPQLPPAVWPSCYIENATGTTMQAQGNCFAPAPPGFVTPCINGPIDSSHSYLATDLFCENPVAEVTKPLAANNLPQRSIIAVGQNYPNPFNPTTDIELTFPVAAHLKVEVFNVLGQRVALLANEEMTAGVHVVRWDGRTDAGLAASSGIYFYRATGGEAVVTKKMILLK